MYFYCLNRSCKGRFSEPKRSITALMMASFLSFTFCPCTFIMHKPDIVDRSRVLTNRSVLNDCSTAQVEAGRVRAISRALGTVGKKSLFLRKSIKLVLLRWYTEMFVSHKQNITKWSCRPDESSPTKRAFSV